MTIPLDPRYIPAFSIEDVLLDKDSGAPLSGGLVYFEIDNQRGVQKPVYQITGESPDYSFIQLPNPVTLSSIGTFEDSIGNPVIPYFFPYDAAGNVELYYVRVTSSEGVPQFVREAQPYLSSQGNDEVLSVITNEISNPQFAEVLFDTSNGAFTYNVNAVTDSVIAFAPDWDLIVSAAGAGSVTLTQLTPAGSLNIDTNPGTILTISSSGLSKLRLRQRKYGSPNLWGSGYISASFVARTYTGTPVLLSMYYSQSNGVVTNPLIIGATLPSSGAYTVFSGSALIPASTSTQTAPSAYIDIYFDIPLSLQIDITSIMLAFTGAANISNISYDQESLDRQVDHLFHYWKSKLEFMPISSYLVGWDFPLNPAQFGEAIAAQPVGANKSYYAWDQTIVFQEADSGLTISREAVIGNIVIQAASTGRHAIIQYLGGKEADEVFAALVLNGVSSNIVMESTAIQEMNIALYWTASASLPSMSTNSSLVTGFDGLTGYPTVLAGWNEIARTGFTKSDFSTSGGLSLESFDFSNFADSTAYNTAKFFAIVVSTKNTVTVGNVVEYKSISLVPGVIPTIPAPQTADEVLRECEYYYTKSYESNTIPGTASISDGTLNFIQPSVASGTAQSFAGAFDVRFRVTMRNVPDVKIYSPLSGTLNAVYAQLLYHPSVGPDGEVHDNSYSIGTQWAQNGISEKGFSYIPIVSALQVLTTGAVSAIASSAYIRLHYEADARLGY